MLASVEHVAADHGDGLPFRISSVLIVFSSPLSLFSRPASQTSRTESDFCTRLQRAYKDTDGEMIDHLLSVFPATAMPSGTIDYGASVAQIALRDMAEGGKVDLIVTVLSSTHIFRQVGSFNCSTVQSASQRNLHPGQALQIWSYTRVPIQGRFPMRALS